MKKVMFMGEGLGMYVKGFKDKSEAVKAMREYAEKEKALYGNDLNGAWGDDYQFDPEDITDESVVETLYWQHRACESETIGDDNLCYECSEPCGTTGRWTFAFFAKQ